MTARALLQVDLSGLRLLCVLRWPDQVPLTGKALWHLVRRRTRRSISVFHDVRRAAPMIIATSGMGRAVKGRHQCFSIMTCRMSWLPCWTRSPRHSSRNSSDARCPLRRGRIGKPVQFRHGPAAVTGESPSMRIRAATGLRAGKADGQALIRESEDRLRSNGRPHGWTRPPTGRRRDPEAVGPWPTTPTCTRRETPSSA